MDEKDRLGDKLREREKAEEDRYFAEREKAVLDKLRQSQGAVQEQEIRELARMRGPKDGARLATHDHHGVTVEECPSCGGMWLDKGELQTVAQRERDSWLGRLFYRPKA